MLFSVVTVQTSPSAELNQISIRRWPSSNSWGVVFSNSSGDTGIISLGNITTPGWYSFGVKWQQGVGGYGYLNGELKGSVAAAYLPSSFNSTANIGSWIPTWLTFDNIIDDLRISSIARANTEIQSTYQSNQPLPLDEYTTCKLGFDGNLYAFPTVESANINFSRSSAAYKQDGTQVGSESARYEEGKFGLGIMFEEVTTNLIDNGNFQSGFSSWMQQGTPAPGEISEIQTDGTRKVYHLYKNAGTNLLRIYQGFTIATNTKYTVSLRAKGVGNVLIWDGTSLAQINVNSPEAYTPYSATFTTGSITDIQVYLQINGGGIGAGECWFAEVQVENKDYATTYCDTTRVGETLTIPTANVFNKGNWSVEFSYIPISQFTTGRFRDLFTIFIDNNNWYKIGTNDLGEQFQISVNSNGVEKRFTTALNPPLTAGMKYSIMFSGDGSVLRGSVNGAQVGSDLPYTEPLGNLPANIYIGSDRWGGKSSQWYH